MVNDRPQSAIWPRLAGVAGLVLAFILTAVIWLQVIERQATAGPGSREAMLGTPAGDESDASYTVDPDGEPRPIP